MIESEADRDLARTLRAALADPVAVPQESIARLLDAGGRPGPGRSCLEAGHACRAGARSEGIRRQAHWLSGWLTPGPRREVQ